MASFPPPTTPPPYVGEHERRAIFLTVPKIRFYISFELSIATTLLESIRNSGDELGIHITSVLDWSYAPWYISWDLFRSVWGSLSQGQGKQKQFPNGQPFVSS